MPSKVWAVGEEVLAAQLNQYVQEQVIATFANAAARTTAIPAPKIGQASFLADTGALELWTDKTAPASWRKPWGQPWGLIAGPQNTTALHPIAGSATIVAGSPLTLTGHPINRRVLFIAQCVCTTMGADNVLSVQRRASVAEEYAPASFGGYSTSQRMTVTINAVFTTVETAQVPELIVRKSTAGTGQGHVESGIVAAIDIGGV